jgi:hypothetical protein
MLKGRHSGNMHAIVDMLTKEQRRKRRSHHVVHDYVNLISAGTEVARSHRAPLNSHLVYSFVLQYRKFADFFANKRKRIGRKKGDVDMLAKDFVSSKIRFDLWEWRKWNDHMNTHVFHLNKLRTNNSRTWTGHTEVPRMLKEFRAAWKSFFDALPDARKAEFKDEIEFKRTAPSEFADLDLYSG